MPDNVLTHLPTDELFQTRLLYALCSLKPLREIILRKFTDGEFGAEDVEQEDIHTFFPIKDNNRTAAIPDLVVLTNELLVLVELKVSEDCALQPTQPYNYLAWAAAQNHRRKYCVLLTPPQYQYVGAWDVGFGNFAAANPNHRIKNVKLNWPQIGDALVDSGLPVISHYARDYAEILFDLYRACAAYFNYNQLQVNDLFNRDTIDGIRNLFSLIDCLEVELEQRGFQIQRYRNKRWWEPGCEYGFNVRCEQQNVLWIGLWSNYWSDHSCPLAIAADVGWDQRVIARFRQSFPMCELYPKNSPDQCWTDCVPRELLVQDNATDAVRDWLLQSFLTGVCDIF